MRLVVVENLKWVILLLEKGGEYDEGLGTTISLFLEKNQISS